MDTMDTTDSKTGLVDHLNTVFKGNHIGQRLADGYLDATAMCTLFDQNKMVQWKNSKETLHVILQLSKDVNIHPDALIETTKGTAGNQCIFIHPMLAIHLAMWISPTFALTVWSL